MTSQPHQKPEIEIHMLGEFSISIDGEKLVNLRGKTKRVWMLVQYLIAHRTKEVSIDQLIDVLWNDQECADPQNALKNLVYRARRSLKRISQNETLEFIKFIGNTYQWNNEYNCVVDTEQLVACWEILKDASKPDEVRIQACHRVVALYRGDFLPNSMYRYWVVSAAAWLSTVYKNCVMQGCELLAKQGRFAEVVDLCEVAVMHVPLEERMHEMLLDAYINTNQLHKAMEHYRNTVKLFRKELGVDVSKSLRPAYRHMVNRANHPVAEDLDVIKNDLQEPAQTIGGYFCSYDAFRCIYHLQMRSLAREKGPSVCTILFTLKDGKDDAGTIRTAMGKLQKAISCSTRKVDIFAKYSPTQYIVMLSLKKPADSQIVISRIQHKFCSCCPTERVQLSFQINATDAVK